MSSMAFTALSVVFLASLGIIAWMFREARAAGHDKASVKELQHELDRAQQTLDILSSPLPSPAAALDILSHENGRATGPVPHHDGNDTGPARVSMRDRH